MRGYARLALVGCTFAGATLASCGRPHDLPTSYLEPRCDPEVETVSPDASDPDYAAYAEWLSTAATTYEMDMTWGDGAGFQDFDNIDVAVGGGGERVVLYRGEFALDGACLGRSFAAHVVEYQLNGVQGGPWVGTGQAYFADGSLDQWRSSLLVENVEREAFEARWLDLLTTLGVVVLDSPPAMLWLTDGTWEGGQAVVYAHPSGGEAQQPSVRVASGTYQAR